MSKKYIALTSVIIASSFLTATASANTEGKYPLMYDILHEWTKKQEEKLKSENTKSTITIPNRPINPQFGPALADNFEYKTIYSGNAITIKSATETPLIVQEIDLTKGARVHSALEVTSYNPTTGEPQYIKKNMTQTIESFNETPTSIINGQFFHAKIQPSELSFGLKTEGEIKSAGADNRNEKKHILHINGDYAEIIPHSWKNLENTKWNFAMVNLSVQESRYKNEKIGRTYMCLAQPIGKNKFSKILTFVAEAMDEGLIENEIYKHGCTPKTTSKLDSSGSSRFWHNGETLYGHNHAGKPDYRIIPHSIAFFDKK